VGRRGGDFGIASRWRWSSCSRAAIACCFLLPLNSPDLDRRNKRPKLERRGGWFFSDSFIGANLSGGDDAPAEGVLGRLVLTIVFDWMGRTGGCRKSDREVAVCGVEFA
jgi:hypothetical protein